MQDDAGATRVTALLGPTNTGKTHRAIERMLDHESGMLGLPLRLLAREVYDRVVLRVGSDAVALVTGEEKRIPPTARYWICTVEAMPHDTAVEFLAIDEIQLSAHRERGHIFTDRMLRARGTRETWFLGAETIRPLLAALVPHAELRKHPRLSELRAVEPTTLGGLSKRSAVVAFSMNRVYEIAERLRHRRGGAAVVLGALSPRARNAQVALYQSGEVDYLVATDAIGMGLNLDLNHVAFADLRKFDGRELRELLPAELAQIAGRAGRHVQNGTFNSLKSAAPLPSGVTRAIEAHRFAPDRVLQWRNPALDFTDVDALLASLKQAPVLPGLRLAEQAEDHDTLLELSRRADIRARLQHPDHVALLWELCQIPDYRQLMLSHHANLVAEIFEQLVAPPGRLSAEFLRQRLARLARYDGDIEQLMSRMAFVRTWTYVSSHGAWAEQATQIREEAHAIEDRLSDALHERLVQRFVVARKGASAVPIKPEKSHPFWALEQLRDELFGDGRERSAGTRSSLAGVLVEADGKLVGSDGVLGQLVRGNDLLNPSVRLLLADRANLDRETLQSQLVTQVRAQVADLLAPCQLDSGVPVSPAVTGLLYSLRVSLGCVERRTVAAQLSALGADDAEELARRRIALGVRWLYLKDRLKPRHTALRAALWNAFQNEAIPVPMAGATFLHAPTQLSDAALLALSHPRVGALGVRVDIAERVLALSHRKDALQATQRLLGAKRATAQAALDALRPRRRRRRRARRAPSGG